MKRKNNDEAFDFTPNKTVFIDAGSLMQDLPSLLTLPDGEIKSRLEDAAARVIRISVHWGDCEKVTAAANEIIKTMGPRESAFACSYLGLTRIIWDVRSHKWRNADEKGSDPRTVPVFLFSGRITPEMTAGANALLQTCVSGIETAIYYEDRQDLEAKVSGYLAQFSEKPSFAVISSANLMAEFGDRNIITEPMPLPGEDLTDQQKNMMKRLHCSLNRRLFYKPSYFYDWDTIFDEDDYRHRIYAPFWKIIFLDIDGVLNDDGTVPERGPAVDPEMVARLSQIVSRTGADIVLSSSWKWGFDRYFRAGAGAAGRKELYGDCIELINVFESYGLSVSGVTPRTPINGGEDARPCEIRACLSRCPFAFSYVILEDDEFWRWGWLRRNVITTITPNPRAGEANFRGYDYIDGLTREQADRAIEILNEDPLIRPRDRE